MIKVEFLSVKNLRWASPDRRYIDCLVKTNTLVGEHGFTAFVDDSEPHGRELYARCLAGEFGEIGPMEPRSIPVPPINQEIPPESKHLEKFFIDANQENGRKSFRSVAIVWGNALDNLLAGIIEEDSSRKEKMGQPRGRRLRSFDDRIKAAKKRGLIDDADAEKCEHIKLVRNAAAHEVPLTLQIKDVLPSLRALHSADHPRILVFHEDLEFLLQQVYAGSCAMLAIKFARSLQNQTDLMRLDEQARD